MIIKPQKGAQEKFLASSADIVIYGGAAGGGKSYSLLLEPLRYISVKGYRAVLLRHSYVQISTAGGLWEESAKIYRNIRGAIAVKSPRFHWNFNNAAIVSFDYLYRDDDVYKWQGAQITFIGFDELCHFSKKMFFYMLSRNRSTCGVKPYIRATCNPDADSWVAEFIQWWINQETGYPIPERSGVVRYMCVLNNIIYWGNSPGELAEKYGIDESDCKSVTFISAKILDNPKLLEADPGYLANLKALPEVEKERLLYGNWKIKASSGMYFKAENFDFIDAVPKKIIAYARSWDLAATEPTPANPNPDATAGVLMGLLSDGRYIVLDVRRKQIKANDVRNLMRNVAAIDQGKYKFVEITIPQDPGQAGKAQAQNLVSWLSGYSVEVVSPTGSKEVRATPFASQVQAGNVLILKAEWNEMYLAELESFPESVHDDMVDASSDAFNKLQRTKSWKGLIE